MKNKLDNYDYTQFIQHLENKGVSYTESEIVDSDVYFTVMTEVKPSNNMKARYFDNDGGCQLD